MSIKEESSMADLPIDLGKRKRDANEEEIEIDVNAPEPPSKKAMRKAKKSKTTAVEDHSEAAPKPKPDLIGAEDVVPNRGKRSDYGIWIGNLSFATTKQELLNFMTGDTENRIAEDKVTRINLPAGAGKFGKFQNKGFAYIDLADDKTLQSAIQLSEKLLGGRRVLIKNANNFEGRPKNSAKEVSSNPPSKRIFVGNLDFETSAEDLESHFQVCGPIESTHMATFEDSGKCKGYAWLEFEQLPAAEAAMRGWVEQETESADGGKRIRRRIWLNKIKGRQLRLEYAEDKTTRYNKRFGKNASQDKLDEEVPAIEEVPVSNTVASTRGPGTGREAAKSHQSRPADQKKVKRGYNEDTVKRLTGAIVESKGSKVTFD